MPQPPRPKFKRRRPRWKTACCHLREIQPIAGLLPAPPLHSPLFNTPPPVPTFRDELRFFPTLVVAGDCAGQGQNCALPSAPRMSLRIPSPLLFISLGEKFPWPIGNDLVEPFAFLTHDCFFLFSLKRTLFSQRPRSFSFFGL